MNWMLFVLLVTTSSSDKAVATATTMPMATNELCNAARAKLKEVHKEFRARHIT